MERALPRGTAALLAAPKLTGRGHEVTSLIRDPAQAADIEATGASPLVHDLTQLSVDEWAERESQFDVVVWSAGNGGKAGDDVTYAVDRGGALASVDGLRKLAGQGGPVPRYVMVSYVGSVNHTREKGDPMYAYTETKKTVDRYLLDSDLEFIILELARGVRVVENEPGVADGGKTSRELVADVIVEMVGRERLPDERILPFLDGDTPVTDL